MIDWCFFMITQIIVNYTQVNMSQKLSCYICNFFMLCMIFNSILKELRFSAFSNLHIVNSNTIVWESFSVDVTNGFTNLQEFFILFNSRFILSKIIKENSCWIVCSSFISRFSCSFTSKCQYVIVFESFLSCYSIVRISITHTETTVAF
jgi:hypothetical protein